MFVLYSILTECNSFLTQACQSADQRSGCDFWSDPNLNISLGWLSDNDRSVRLSLAVWYLDMPILFSFPMPIKFTLMWMVGKKCSLFFLLFFDLSINKLTISQISFIWFSIAKSQAMCFICAASEFQFCHSQECIQIWYFIPGTLNAIIPVLKAIISKSLISSVPRWQWGKNIAQPVLLPNIFQPWKPFHIKDKIIFIQISSSSDSKRNSSMNENYSGKDVQDLSLKLHTRSCHKKVIKWIVKPQLLLFWFCTELSNFAIKWSSSL